MSDEKIIGYLHVGGTLPGSHEDAADTRNVGEVRPPWWAAPGFNTGWSDYMARVVDPAIAWGCNEFLIQWPFGVNLDGTCAWDAFLQLRGRSMYLAAGWFSEWRAKIDAGIEVTAYLGNPAQSPELERVYGRGEWRRWRDGALKAIDPILGVGMGLGVDAVVSLEEWHPTYRLLRELHSQGVPIYVETRPEAARPKWNTFTGTICDDAFWRSQGSEPWAIPDEDVSGRIIRGLYGVSDATTIATKLQEIIADGHTGLATIAPLIAADISPDDIISLGPL